MRRFVSVLWTMLLLALPAAAVSPTHVTGAWGLCTGAGSTGHMTTGTCTAATSKTFTYTAGATNNGLLFFTEVNCNSGTLTAINLTASGWTITAVTGTIGATTATGFARTWKAYAPNTSATTFTLAVTGTCANSFMLDMVSEWSGVDQTNFVDNSFATFDASAGACDQVITPVANDVGIVSFCGDNEISAGTGFTLENNDTGGDVSEWRTITGGAGASQAVPWASSAPPYNVSVVTVKASGAAAVVPTRSLMGVGQ